MSKVIKIKKGLDIRLEGKPEEIMVKVERSETYSVKPADFVGVMPKLTVKEGDKVLAGSTLFYNKKNPRVLFSSPVSGEVIEINRGERRTILEIIIRGDEEIKYEEFKKTDPLTLSREEIIDNLLKSGVWPFIRQRPYATIANPDTKPKSIFISGFDKAPLAPDYDFILKGQEGLFQKGIDVLSKLTDGKIHLNVNAEFPVANVYKNAVGVELNQFSGPHPAGNVGVQMHHIDPVNKGEVVWYVNPQDVLIIGRLFEKGVFDASRVVALTGSEVKNPRYFKTIMGSQITPLIRENIKEGELRFISGNVLTGSKIYKEGHIGFYDSQVTVIPEGNHFEFLGWAMPGLNKFSASRTFFSWLAPGKKYRLDSNLNGGERAFVLTGNYEKVLPMDILPMHLIKACMIQDIDLMEKLGIYELAEEDIALCEFVCPSKIEFQSILRKGIELMILELE